MRQHDGEGTRQRWQDVHRAAHAYDASGLRQRRQRARGRGPPLAAAHDGRHGQEDGRQHEEHAEGPAGHGRRQQGAADGRDAEEAPEHGRCRRRRYA